MHNRVGPNVALSDLGLADLVAIVPIVLVILALAFFPQFGLTRSQSAVRATVAPARQQASQAFSGAAQAARRPSGKLAQQ